jgi:hypothetical protein
MIATENNIHPVLGLKLWGRALAYHEKKAWVKPPIP